MKQTKRRLVNLDTNLLRPFFRKCLVFPHHNSTYYCPGGVNDDIVIMVPNHLWMGLTSDSTVQH